MYYVATKFKFNNSNYVILAQIPAQKLLSKFSRTATLQTIDFNYLYLAKDYSWHVRVFGCTCDTNDLLIGTNAKASRNILFSELNQRREIMEKIPSPTHGLCSLPAPHSSCHLPPGKQELQSCKFPLLFPPVPGWSSPGAAPAWAHSPPLSQRLPVPGGHPAPWQQVSRRRTITSIGK